MTAKEIREFRTVSNKLVEVEERCKLLEQLKKYKIGFNEEEMFTDSFSKKFKILVKGRVSRRNNMKISSCCL